MPQFIDMPEPGTALLSEETRATIDSWVARFPADRKRSAVIQSLMAAQDQNGGWLTNELIEAVARYLDLPPVWAAEVASFYSMFDLKPVGRHKVNVCTNISCQLLGAEELLHHVVARHGDVERLGGRRSEGDVGHEGVDPIFDATHRR